MTRRSPGVDGVAADVSVLKIDVAAMQQGLGKYGRTPTNAVSVEAELQSLKTGLGRYASVASGTNNVESDVTRPDRTVRAPGSVPRRSADRIDGREGASRTVCARRAAHVRAAAAPTAPNVVETDITALQNDVQTVRTGLGRYGVAGTNTVTVEHDVSSPGTQELPSFGPAPACRPTCPV